jgi:hypothetical protein
VELMANTDFRVWPFRFHFVAAGPVVFPEGKAANVLRGAFGTVFRQLACVPECREARSCEIARECPYALVFEPRQEWAEAAGPSGLADWPRPFVFRALHLDGVRLQPGETFHFDVNLFEAPNKVLPYFVLAFRQLAEAGLGPAHGRAGLARVEDLAGYDGQPQVVYDGTRLHNRELAGMRFEFSAEEKARERLTVRFLTPTEMKSGGELVDKPEFGVLLRRLRDRISNLRVFYQGGPLAIDFEELGRAADEVRIVRNELRRVEAERLSSRTGQRHSLGGFVGEVEYEGALGTLTPFLRAGEWVGVGRQTVWGKGCLEVVAS